MFARLAPLLLQGPVLTGLLLCLLASASLAHGQRLLPPEDGNCQLEPGDESTVLSISGPQTLHLADGRTVHLSGILAPAAPGGAGSDPALSATAYLRSKALGKRVEVRYGGNHHDRYGAAMAHVFVAGEPPLWLQEGLVSEGLAQVFPQPDNHACSAQLLAMEGSARDQRRGYWGLALFKILPARETRSMQNLMQTYQIIEGEIVSVTHGAGRAILRFAGDSKASFTVTIEPAALRRLPAGSLEDWQGKTVRIRGWIERKKGPAITIAQPQQIELPELTPSKPASPDKPQ